MIQTIHGLLGTCYVVIISLLKFMKQMDDIKKILLVTE